MMRISPERSPFGCLGDADPLTRGRCPMFSPTPVSTVPKHMSMHTSMHTSMHMSVHMSLHFFILTSLHTSIRNVYSHVYLHVHWHLTCPYTCVYTCPYKCLCTLSMHIVYAHCLYTCLQTGILVRSHRARAQLYCTRVPQVLCY